MSYAIAGGRRHRALDVAQLDVEPGAIVGFTGPSGAGKTTLLYVLSGIERLDSGMVRWDDVDLATLNENQRDRWRRLNLGFVFQEINLIPGMSVLHNVTAAIAFESWRTPPRLRERAISLLDRVEISSNRVTVDTLSRGEQQRVAIARALLRQPRIIVADEPTASLDAQNGGRVVDLLLEVCRESRATMLAVTHDPMMLERLPRVHRLLEGKLV
ncbi:MAG: ABC transporter ATP-binding protein [Gammaproteobacteria bacterium]